MHAAPQAASKIIRRSSLFVPGDRPDRFLTAVKAGAGIVIIDLEDAVAASEKDKAREFLKEFSETISEACRQHNCDLFVRVNNGNTPWHEEDIRAVASLSVDGVLLPKPVSSDQVKQVWEACRRKPLHLLMETAYSFSVIAELAGAPGVERLMLGCADLMTELDIEDDDDPLHSYRTQLLQHSVLAGLQPPIDGVCLALYDAMQLQSEIVRAKRFGFGAKACIHPNQVSQVEAEFIPTPEKLEWARRVVEASSDGSAASLDGRLIDGPIVIKARRLLADFPS